MCIAQLVRGEMKDSGTWTRLAYVVVIIPCFNESERLELAQVHFLLESGISLLFVNDGSTDSTAELLDGLWAKNPDTVRVLHLQKNSGKGEAVRRGLLKAIEDGATVVGFADADFATPPARPSA